MLEVLTEIFKGIVSLFLTAWPVFALLLGFFAWQNHRKANYVVEQEDVLLEIKIPKTNDKSATAAEMMFATLHGILRPKVELVREGAIQEHISFEIVADMNSIRFFVWTPKHLKDFVEGQVYAQYPSAEIGIVEDYSKKITEEELKNISVKGAEIALTKDDFLPIKTFNNFTVDPLAGITGVLSKVEEKNEQIWIQVLARPVTDEWKKRGLNWVTRKKGGTALGFNEDFSQWLIKAPAIFVAETLKLLISGPSESAKAANLSAEDQSRISAVELKAEKLGYRVKIRTAYIGDPAKANEKLYSIYGAFKQFNTTMLNGFRGKSYHGSASHFLTDYRNRLFISGGFHLNIEELASIYHMPHTSVETPNINWTTYKTGEPPTNLPTTDNTHGEEFTPFAETNFRSHKQVFGMRRDDRRRHMYIIGKSGMGKTKLLQNMINHDIKSGEGVAVIDPHGDLIADTIAKIPDERIKDVIIFDPSDVNFPIAFNPMEVLDEGLKIQIAAGVVGTFKKIFGHSWGPRLEYVFNYTVLALLDTPGTTLLGVVRMLTDKNYRKIIVGNIKDPVVKKFWTTEYASYSEKFATEAVAPILNKVGQFVANSLIRNIIGQPKSSFVIREAMDEGKILLINLSTGRVGETNAALLGSLMITAIQLAAMSRANISEKDRKDFFLYVDEFQNFATESFKNILSEARKYHLNLIMANQYIGQMEDTGVKDAVFGNVGTMITFRVGAADANELAKEFNPPFEPQDLINLARQHIYIKMTIDGQSEQAFSAKTLTVSEESTGNVDKIINSSREHYTKQVTEVERDVAQYAGIEIETTPVGTETEVVTVETPESTIVATDYEVFEAPLVKKVGKKNKKQSDRERKEQLKEIIKENTSGVLQATDTKKEDTAKTESLAEMAKKVEKGEELPEIDSPVPEEKPETPVKVKDKIDKEVLSEILKAIVTPAEGNDDNNKNENKKADQKEDQAQTENINININKKTLKKNVAKDRGESHQEKDAKEIKEEKNINDSPSHSHSHGVEKIITPDNFKHVKQIHPHEVVKIVTESPKDISEGESIKFD